ncbi:MAG: N-methyl-L-tryptophan oxidase [Sodalis sp.]|nr:MAG: N-methyl-L-tryptophan oxidase [Sodalis sp.]
MAYDLIVIGSGPCGGRGFYAMQAGLNALMIDATFPPHSGRQLLLWVPGVGKLDRHDACTYYLSPVGDFSSTGYPSTSW